MAEEIKDEFTVWPMFAVKTKNQQGQEVQRKASDNEGLLRWMEMKEITASICNIDLDKTNDKSIAYLKAKVLEENWFQLKLLIQDSLGLLKQPEPEPEPEVMDEEPEIIEPQRLRPDNTKRPILQPQQQQQQQKPRPRQQQQPQQMPDEDFFESEPAAVNDDDDDEVVL